MNTRALIYMLAAMKKLNAAIKDLEVAAILDPSLTELVAGLKFASVALQFGAAYQQPSVNDIEREQSE